MNAIVAVDQNWAIGKDGHLLFNLSADMKRFRALTTGGVVLLGRKTLETFPGGKPLAERRNVVLTTAPIELADAEIVHTPEQLRLAAQGADPEHVFVVGGGSVYAALLPYCAKALVTRIDAVTEDPDTFFPNLDKSNSWSKVSESEPITENGVTFRFVEYKNEKMK